MRHNWRHIEEVQDLCWNSDGTLLLSGSIDTSARLWQVSTGQCLHAFRESKGLVQGVAIDPLGKFIATFADDKSVRMYHATNKRCAYRNTKFVFDDKAVKLFGDTGDGFFHRICFSPHGEFFVVPSGSFPISAESSIFCTYVYCRDNLSKPVLYLPSGRRPSVSVSFCPIKFKYRNETENSENVRPNLFNLSYRLVFAVITENSVLFYDTERFEVFAKVENIHYASLNSGSWCKDGTMFVATSSDGYATICTFEESELGEKVTEAEIAFQTVQTPQSTPIVNCDAKVSQDDENLLTSNSAEILKEEENSEKKEDDEIERLDNQKPESKNLPLVAEAKIATSNHSENGPSTPSKMETHLNNKQQQIIDLDKTPTNEKQGLLSVNTSQPSTPVSRNGKGKLAPLALKTILKPASPAELKTNSPAVSPKNVSFSPKMKQRLVPTKSKTNASSKKQNTHKSKNIDTSSNQIASAFARGSRILAESLKNQKAEDARPQSDPNNPIFIDDDSIPEVVPSSGPLIDKSNEINLVSPGSNLSSAPTTPKSILKTPSPDSPMPSEGSKKRRVSFRTLELPPCKESKKEESEQQSCSVEKTAEESKSSQPVPGKKRKIAFTTIS
ncbi:uncharacterized protein LOC134854728 [Symsagittifera roscoffensis]|uniref:uncharacterized protein LOC134854728 n=1 Tax=Symsagittifera roscoffensis TaxID=84072 RepID=UPI00307C640C